MLMPWVMFFAVLSSLLVPVGAVVAIVAYIKRTRVIQAGMEDGSPHSAVMDSLDQVHIRLDAMSHRLGRLEETLQLSNVIPEEVRDSEATQRAFPIESREKTTGS